MQAELIDSGKALETAEQTDRSQQPPGGGGMTDIRAACRPRTKSVRGSDAKKTIALNRCENWQCRTAHNGEYFAFEKALRKDGLCVLFVSARKHLPSKGLIASEFPYLEIAKEYEAAGADCISVLD
ncbi:hypothetical protein [Hominenteromicrobium sp.]|uniref:hypothetical protein n=1 Tax=Hominenteromicrobium sp. TaxID=3073581 RepID=UPI0039999374